MICGSHTRHRANAPTHTEGLGPSPNSRKG